MNKTACILILFSFVAQIASANDLVGIKPKVKEVKSFQFLQFNISNKISKDVYCRKIALPNVEYLSEGEFFTSFEASVSDLYMKGFQKNSLLQNKSSDLINLYSSGESFKIRFDARSLVSDCERIQTRINNIYVLDDKRRCGGKHVSVKHLYVDFGKNTLIPSGEKISIPLSNESKIFKDTYTRSWIKQEGDQLYILSSEDNRHFEQKHLISLSNSKNRKYLGLTWIGPRTPILFFIDRGGLEIKLYFLEAGNNLKFISSARISLGMWGHSFQKEFSENSEYNKRLGQILKDNYDDFKKGVIVFYKYYPDHDALKVNIAYRSPKIRGHFTRLDLGKNKWVSPKPFVYNQTASNRIFEQVIFDINSSRVRPSIQNRVGKKLFFMTVDKEGFERLSSFGTQEKAKNFKLQAFKTKLEYKFDSEVKEIDGFCNIQQIFSDKVSPRDEVNLDSLFLGRNKMIRAVQAKSEESYKELVDLLSRGASVNSVADIFGNRPLHWAVKVPDLKFFKLLLSSNADVNIQNDDFETPLMIYIESSFMSFVNHSDYSRKRIATRSREVISLLLKHGAKLELKNNVSETAYDIAKKHDAPEEILQLLRSMK